MLSEAVENNQHFLNSNSVDRVTDSRWLIAAYKESDEYITDKDMKHPVVLLSDGHNPCYEYDVLNLLHLKNKWLFLMPQNTTDKA